MPVVLSVKDVVSTHLAILASTGAGKSYAAGVLIEELLMPNNRAAALIVDPHSEYGTLQEIHKHPSFSAADYKPEVKIFTPGKIKVRISTLTEADIVYLLPEMTEKMRTFLSQAYKALINTRGAERGTWGFNDLLNEVLALRYEDAKGQGGGNVSTIDGLEWRLRRRFEQSHIFSDHEHIPLQDLFRPGQCTVLQLSEIEENEQQVIVGALLRRTNKARVATVRGNAARGDESLPYPVFVLLEEAHRYAPAGQQVVSTNILKQILSEGRKFGVGIGLITQRPGKLDQDVLSQCMTQIHHAHRQPDRSADHRLVGRRRGAAVAGRIARLDQRPGDSLRRGGQHARAVPQSASASRNTAARRSTRRASGGSISARRAAKARTRQRADGQATAERRGEDRWMGCIMHGEVGISRGEV